MQYNNKYQLKKNTMEKIKWLILVFLFILILGVYSYKEISIILRSTILVVLISLISLTFFFTKKGKFICTLAKEAKIESRKIIWPNYQETFYTTLIISGVTIFVSFLLWGLDSMLVYLISVFTHLRFL